ncbi:hypothetical protein [Merismopedia glauca]|uniref:Uncharacterized protein n=1 Tax=Merismopedia glauca CCAP 1448/3 TaxID=1296344 RepID=A0A2T1BX49_9CYAN|nr:hypothetical protein [Merismopedia glauca]PSB00503.1 hypothetical protein C7B64_23170 [Merismopedia glauca CCAP 1448/3]
MTYEEYPATTAALSHIEELREYLNNFINKAESGKIAARDIDRLNVWLRSAHLFTIDAQKDGSFAENWQMLRDEVSEMTLA